MNVVNGRKYYLPNSEGPQKARGHFDLGHTLDSYISELFQVGLRKT